MSATQNAGQLKLADAQALSGFRTKAIRGNQSRIIDFAWISPEIEKNILDKWKTHIFQITGARSFFFDDTDGHLTTLAINFDEAELAADIIEVLRKYTPVWYDKCTKRRPASDTTATFTIIPFGYRVTVYL